MDAIQQQTSISHRLYDAQACMNAISQLAWKVIDCIESFFKHYICCYPAELTNIETTQLSPPWERVASRLAQIGKWIFQLKREHFLYDANGVAFLNLERKRQEVKPMFQLVQDGIVQAPILKIKLNKQQLRGFPPSIRGGLENKYIKLYLTVYAGSSSHYRKRLMLSINNKQGLHTGCFEAVNITPTRNNGMRMESYALWHSSQTVETFNVDEKESVSYGMMSWFNQTHGGAEITIFLNNPDTEEARVLNESTHIHDMIDGLKDIELGKLLKKIFIEFAYQGKISLS
ncbi:MAG: hypothetical protein HY860_03340 [Chlamydiales bacterium]|nr:hypothetical protein [Chlamydiales bacterium]